MVELTPELRPRALECPTCGQAVIAEPKGFVVSGMDVDDEEPLERWTLFACEKQHPILTSERDIGSTYDGGSDSFIDIGF